MPIPQSSNAPALSDRDYIERRATRGHHRSCSHRSTARLIPALAFTLAMSVGLPLAFAQTLSPAAQSDQDHNAHHPERDQGAPSGATATPAPAPAQGQAPTRSGGMPMMGGMGQDGMMRQGGMMGQGGSSGMGDMGQMMGDMSRMMSGMGRMMGAMGQMMPMMAGMMARSGSMGMPFEHVEGRLAFLKAELKITPAQEPQWNKFADAYRSVANTDRERLPQMRQQMMQGGGAQAVATPERIDRYEQMLTMRLDAVRTMKAAFDPLYASLSDDQKKTADQLLSGPMGLM